MYKYLFLIQNILKNIIFITNVINVINVRKLKMRLNSQMINHVQRVVQVNVVSVNTSIVDYYVKNPLIGLFKIKREEYVSYVINTILKKHYNLMIFSGLMLGDWFRIWKTNLLTV